MASKKMYITDLYKATLKDFNDDQNSWIEFLSCAAMNYKYSFSEQVLIYAQKPNAIACNTLEDWNKKFNRWVNKDSKGIAIIDESNGNTYLRFVFDVADTNNHYGKRFRVWNVNKNYEQDIIESLQNKYIFTEETDDFATAIIETANCLVEYNIQDYGIDAFPNIDIIETKDQLSDYLKVFIKNSVAFMMLKRCGYDVNEHFDRNDVKYILELNDPKILTDIGTAINDISRMGISEIYKSSRNVQMAEINKIRTFEQKTKKGYDNYEGRDSNDKLRKDGGLRDSELSAASQEINSELREIRSNETRLSQEEQKSRISESDSERSTDRLSNRDTGSSRTENREYDYSNGGAGELNRGTQSHRSDEMGGNYEQLESPSGGNSKERTDLQLDFYDKDSVKTFRYFLVDETFNKILSTIELGVSNNEIKQFFESEQDITKRAEYLRSAYNNLLNIEVVISDEKFNLKVYENGIYALQSDYKNNVEDYAKDYADTHNGRECFHEWEDLTDHYQSMLLLKQLPILLSEQEQISLIEEQRNEITFTQEFVDRYFQEKHPDTKYRIYKYFQESFSSKENIDFIKDLFGYSGGSHAVSGSGVGYDTSPSKGITLYVGYFEDRNEIVLNWNKVEKTIKELIRNDRFLNTKEMEHYPLWLDEMEQQKQINEQADRLTNYTEVEVESYDYEYHLGDKVYIGADEYEILAFDDKEVRLYDFQWPLFNKEYPRDEFDKKVKENPANDYLKVKIKLAKKENNVLLDYNVLAEIEYNFQTKSGYFLHLHPNDEGYDFSYYDSEKILIDGGILENDDYMPLKDILEGIAGLIDRDELHTSLQDLLTPEELIEVDEIEENTAPIEERVQKLRELENHKVNETEFFYIDEESQKIELVYYNPDSEAGGQYVVDSFYYADILKAKEEYTDPTDFFDYVQSNCHRELADVGTEYFDAEQQRVQSGTHNFIGLTEQSMNKLIELSTSGENIIGKELEIDNRKYVIDKVSDSSKEVTLTDITFQDNVGFPIGRIENLDYVQKLLSEKEKEDLIPKWERKSKVTIFDPHPEIKLEDRNNFNITDDNLGIGTPREKFNRNYEAIRVLKQCEKENRFATPEEQEILSQYIGWGGLQEAFDPNNNSWANEYLKLKNILDDEEYKSARESVLTSFYTPPVVVRAIYKALENMNLKNANILEPSCGVGNFLGMLPSSMGESKLYGVEIDSISGKIAQQLYQKYSIAVKGYEDVNLPDSFFDAVIGNVPFGNFKVLDKRYDKNNFLIHDYFFAKTLDKVRPGGVVAFITSKGTMDKDNVSVRKYIAQRADLLGAIRLPDNTFKSNAGTEVTADIIFLQKRDSITDIEPEWVYTDFYSYDPDTKINNYFVDHPEMVLGDLVVDTTQFGYDLKCKAMESGSLEEQLNDAIQNIYAEIKDYEIEELDDEEDLSIPATPDVKNFSYTLVDGQVYYRENSKMFPQELAVTTLNRVKGMIEIRDCTRLLIEMQMEDYPDYEIKEQQAKLNIIYDSFNKKYGLINSRANSSAFSNDNSYFLLCSLEILDENRELLKKADIFSKRTIRPQQKITSVDNSNEALIVSLKEKALIDFDFMRTISGKDVDELIKDLKGSIFRVPEYGNPNNWVTADEYLSGNVREKLKIAEQFANDDSDFEINVQALKEVQPIDLEPSEISIRLGATWIPEDIIKDFVIELLDPSSYARYNIKVHYSQYTSNWNIEGKSYDSNNVRSYNTYGTGRANAYKIIEDSLNLRDTRIFDYYDDPETGKRKSELNKKETAIAQAKQEQIKQAFAEWIWNDPERRNRLKDIYNERFNAIRTREFDGSNITFNGINPEITLREHQTNAIARIIFGGNTLLAHEVGAGKTFEMVSAAMESKRLGLCNKSLFVVPNHIIEQFASEFLQLYPSANILVSTRKDFETANRKKFCSRIATGEYDAVIIGHSQFEKIPMSVARQIQLLEKQIDDITDGVDELKRNRGENFTIKQLVKTRKSLEDKLKKLNDQSRKDDVITFEELGIDRLFIDEAHYYKNLYLYTKMRNVAGIAQTEAQKSSDLFMKCQYLDELTDAKGIIFATGTPISNSMVELYTMQRYLQYSKLLKHNLQHFDAWASTFGETITAIELAPEGTGYRAKTRFAKFYNLPELMNMFKEVADVQTSDMLNLPVPDANYHNVVVKPSELQKGMVKELAERAEAVRDKRVSPKEDNMLKITNDGRKLALDQRLINEMLPDFEESKVTTCANNIHKIWSDTNEKRLTQLVFCDLSTPNSEKFNVYNDIKLKLIEKDIPETEIAFIHEADTEIRKKELFAKVRKGQVRILMGSTQKMGAGTNCQDKLIALHDLDCPWRPSDLIQRSGRIIRQGNNNPEVEIFRYVTESTFDAYLYQLVENKQRFISQIMTSKTPVRVAEDIDEAALSYAEIKALAAGNPLIIEKTDLDTQVAKLKLLKQSHLSSIYSVEDKVIKYYPSEIKRLETKIVDVKVDIEHLKSNTLDNDKFQKMIINGISYTEKADAGKQLIECFKTMNNPDPIPIGEYRGFKMELGFETFSRTFFLNMRNKLSYKVELGTDIHGNITRIDNVLDSINKTLEDSVLQLENVKKQYENAKVEVNRPFPQEEELKQKAKRLDEVNILLNLNQKDTELIDDELDEDDRKSGRDYER